MSPTLKKGLHWLGSTLAAAGVIFVVVRLRNYGAEIEFSRFALTEWLIVAGLALIYGFAGLMLAFAWSNLLLQLRASTTLRWSVKTYGVSQLAKYVPGNIFHLAGRQAMGMAAGVPAWPLAKSTIWEFGLISAAGLFFVFWTIPLLMDELPASVGMGAFLLTVSVAVAVLWRQISPLIARTFVWYVGFLAVSGALFVGIMELVTSADTSEASLPWSALCGAYVLAWLAGLVTPGAPAGMGVRELVLLFMLNGIVIEEDLLMAIVLGRIVTVMGDVLYFTVAFMIKARPEMGSPQ